MHRLRFPAAAALLFLVSFLTPQLGCKSDVEQQVALARLAQTCLVNTDCQSPLVCAFEACHAECESSRDCEGDARCVAAARPYKVCQLEQERLCERTTDCAEGLICGIDGECRDGCMTDSQCVEGQSCVSGTCADLSELDADGQLEPVTSSARGAEGAPCVYVSDCNGMLLCRGQACLPECRADQDCGAHQVCKDARCAADGTEPTACTYNSDCDAKAGERCVGGGCRCSCVEDRDCPSGQLCDGCGCNPDPKLVPECAYNSDCKTAGQICKSGTCACECQTGQDCKTGETCDGCGCVSSSEPVNGIVFGTVTLYSSFQLPLYRGVKEIHGGLLVTTSLIEDLGDTFDQLERVDGPVTIQSSGLKRLSFPKLVAVQDLQLSYSLELAELDVPLLERADITLYALPKLTQLSLNKLTHGSIKLSNVSFTELKVPLLEESDTISLEDSMLTKLELPSLTTIDSTLSLRGMHGPLLLTQLLLPQLKSIGNQYGGQVSINAAPLTDLSTAFGKLEQVKVGLIEITNNPALSVCQAKAFADKWLPMGNTHTDGNLACAVACTGSVCPN